VEIAYEEAYIKDNRGPTLIGITTMFLALGILAVLGRLISRRIRKAALAADDWLALFSLVRVLLSSFFIHIEKRVISSLWRY